MLNETVQTVLGPIAVEQLGVTLLEPERARLAQHAYPGLRIQLPTMRREVYRIATVRAL